MEKLVKMREITEQTNLSKYTVLKLVEANRFPKPIVLTERMSVWKESEVQKFINDPEGYADYLADHGSATEHSA